MKNRCENKNHVAEENKQPETLEVPPQQDYRRDLPPKAARQFIADKIHAYQEHEKNIRESDPKYAEKAKVHIELYKALNGLVNEDAILSGSQQRSLSDMIRHIGQEFRLAEELVIDTGWARCRVMSLAIYVNTCRA